MYLPTYVYVGTGCGYSASKMQPWFTALRMDCVWARARAYFSECKELKIQKSFISIVVIFRLAPFLECKTSHHESPGVIHFHPQFPYFFSFFPSFSRTTKTWEKDERRYLEPEQRARTESKNGRRANVLPNWIFLQFGKVFLFEYPIQLSIIRYLCIYELWGKSPPFFCQSSLRTTCFQDQ